MRYADFAKIAEHLMHRLRIRDAKKRAKRARASARSTKPADLYAKKADRNGRRAKRAWEGR